MKKIKISILAKETGQTVEELIVILKDLGIEVKTKASSVDLESVKIVKELLEKPKTAPAPETKIETKIEPKIEPNIEPKKEPEPSKETEPKPAPEPEIKIIKIEGDSIVVKNLADLLQIKTTEVIKELMKKGFMVNINQSLASEAAVQIAEQFGAKAEIIRKVEKKHEVVLSDKHKLVTRPPVVTIMGHVDHGKTKLLDAIRQTKVAEGEAGGITQHIGAYQVKIKDKKITFLDTPGHEAFTALRARGARVTDIAVLVVAADDGVMPQTIEAIDHAKAAGVPIIVAINKIDKADSNPDKVKQQLAEHKLIPEDWGGETITVPISALQKKGMDELLEMILLVAEVQELKANPDVSASGVVIESKLDKGRGPVATILIKNGTLKIGDPFVIGSVFGKVKALNTEAGKRIKHAPPSMAVELLGASDVPQPGELMEVVKNEKEARRLAGTRLEETKIAHRGAQTLEGFSQHVKEGEKKDLNIILKADVKGSLEALAQSLRDIEVGGNKINIIHAQVGGVSESDILLAEASNAIVIGFHTNVSVRAREMSRNESVSIRTYNIIYKVIEDIKKAMEGMLSIEYEEVVIGRGDVRDTFKYSKIGVIAGCFITFGIFKRGAGLRVIRENEQIFEGKIEFLKRFKDDVKEVQEGYECGVAVQGYSNFKVGDKLEVFEMREKIRI
ncbi:MAG: translation initiation factor IF-2 [Candidatus Saganbacteria bacterium]|nr:translation initiation factor IF-2 [Candidatus Saganbacteria bacterium]